MSRSNQEEGDQVKKSKSGKLKHGDMVTNSLKVLGFNSWEDLEKEGDDGVKKFDKEKLDAAFRKKIIEIEMKSQKKSTGNNRGGGVEEKVKHRKDKDNRILMETIISRLIGKKTKVAKVDDPDIYQAYQLILSEHYKTKKKKSKTKNYTSKGKNAKKRMSLPTPTTLQVPLVADSSKNLNPATMKPNLQDKKPKKKKADSSGYGQRVRSNSVSTIKTSDLEDAEEQDFGNPVLNYVNELTRAASYSNVRESKFKQKVKKLQATTAVTRLFNEAGSQKHLDHWKVLL